MLTIWKTCKGDECSGITIGRVLPKAKIRDLVFFSPIHLSLAPLSLFSLKYTLDITTIIDFPSIIYLPSSWH